MNIQKKSHFWQFVKRTVLLGQEIQKARSERQVVRHGRQRSVYDSTNERTGKPRLSRKRRGLHA